jgi:outer membrane receptor for ferrienterochelin and colicins
MMPRRLILASLLAAFGSAHAQQATVPATPAPTAKAAEPAAVVKAAEAAAKDAAQPVIEIKGAADAMRRNDTATKIVVTNEELVKYGDSNVLESMKRLPGVTVSGTSVRMRGLGNGYTQFLVNGERPPAGFSLDTLAPEMVERVEIVRAATAEFSTQAIAGTINIVLKKSVSKASREYRVQAGGAHDVRQGNANFSMSDRTDAMSYTLGASLFHNQQHNPSSSVTEGHSASGALTELRTTSSQDGNGFTGMNLNSRLNWKLGGEDSLTWQTFANAGRFNADSDVKAVTLAGPIYPYSGMLVDVDGRFRSVRSDLNWVAKFTDGGKLDAKLGGFRNAGDRLNNRLGRNAANVLTLDRDYIAHSSDLGMSSTGKYSAPWLPGHLLAFGWDGGANKYRESEEQDDKPLPGFTPFDFNNNFDASIRRLAAFAQDEWDITKDWSLYLGARWEGVQTRVTGVNIDSTSRLSVLSPLMQTLYKIPGRKGDQLRFALTKTYKAPAMQQLVPRNFISSFNTAIAPDSSGNPNLKPELAMGIDAGFEHYWAESALLSVAVSSREIDGLIRNEVRLVGDRYVSAPRNQGKAHVKGLELEAKFPLKAVINDAPNIDLRSSISRNWSTVDGVPGPGARLERQPRLSANFGFDIKLGVWSGGSSFTYVEGAWTRTSLTDSGFNSSRRDLETYVVYKFTPKIQVRLSAQNLLRPTNENASRYVGPNGSYDVFNTSPVRAGWRLGYEHKL